ncbi:serine/arginine repetitive matrix protein 1-like [Numida meleagris]|uniref:serine/arginine repetitive matrix protein 1-like n=1 Tax=Numida meleagris TaxID=8996 RepID=UPI000B3E18A3|nr:serine/arginine repetitive matrix protein 1-like [Numida meleagris]
MGEISNVPSLPKPSRALGEPSGCLCPSQRAEPRPPLRARLPAAGLALGQLQTLGDAQATSGPASFPETERCGFPSREDGRQAAPAVDPWCHQVPPPSQRWARGHFWGPIASGCPRVPTSPEERDGIFHAAPRPPAVPSAPCRRRGAVLLNRLALTSPERCKRGQRCCPPQQRGPSPSADRGTEPGTRRGPAGPEPERGGESSGEERRAERSPIKAPAGPGSGGTRREQRRGAMEQYFSATQKMEQEVMFPSLLRGVFPQDGADPAAGGPADLYERYQLLKAIKPVVERGLASVTERSSAADTDTDADGATGAASGAEGSLEERLCHHMNGLQQVLTDLTKNTKALTRRYSQILEEISPGDAQPSW